MATDNPFGSTWQVDASPASFCMSTMPLQGIRELPAAQSAKLPAIVNLSQTTADCHMLGPVSS